MHSLFAMIDGQKYICSLRYEICTTQLFSCTTRSYTQHAHAMVCSEKNVYICCIWHQVFIWKIGVLFELYFGAGALYFRTLRWLWMNKTRDARDDTFYIRLYDRPIYKNALKWSSNYLSTCLVQTHHSVVIWDMAFEDQPETCEICYCASCK